MNETKKTPKYSKEDHPIFNIWVHFGFIIKVLMALALLSGAWLYTQ